MDFIDSFVKKLGVIKAKAITFVFLTKKKDNKWYLLTEVRLTPSLHVCPVVSCVTSRRRRLDTQLLQLDEEMQNCHKAKGRGV